MKVPFRIRKQFLRKENLAGNLKTLTQIQNGVMTHHQNKGHSDKTAPLDHVNVASFHLALGFNCFLLFCQEAKTETEQEDLHPHILAATVALIEDEPEDEEVDPDFQVTSPKATSFDLDGPNTQGSTTPHIIEDEEDCQVDCVTGKFLKHHQKFNHCSPRRMQPLACSGVIDKLNLRFTATESGWSIPCPPQPVIRMENLQTQKSAIRVNRMLWLNCHPSKSSNSVGSVSCSTAHWLPYSTAGIACPLTFTESRPWLVESPGTSIPGPASHALAQAFCQKHEGWAILWMPPQCTSSAWPPNESTFAVWSTQFVLGHIHLLRFFHWMLHCLSIMIPSCESACIPLFAINQLKTPWLLLVLEITHKLPYHNCTVGRNFLHFITAAVVTCTSFVPFNKLTFNSLQTKKRSLWPSTSKSSPLTAWMKQIPFTRSMAVTSKSVIIATGSIHCLAKASTCWWEDE